MIPKVIHYCWFGHGEMSQKELDCINSWHKFCPGYEIVEWNEDNFDFSECRYAQTAYELKKWAFVSDYARFKILYDHGGLYFDTDVELIKPIDDIVANGPFMGCERDAGDPRGMMVAPGLGLACAAGHEVYREVISSYENDTFVDDEGEINYKTVVVRVTEILEKYGLTEEPGIQEVDGITIYPSEYFNPKEYETGVTVITDNTRSIHHFSMSWLPDSWKKEHDIYAVFARHGLGNRATKSFAKLAAVVLAGDLDRIKHRLRRT